MSSSKLNKISMVIACVAVFALAVFSGNLLISYLFDDDRGSQANASEELDTVFFKDEVSDRDSEIEAKPEIEPEPKLIVADTEEVKETLDSEKVTKAPEIVEVAENTTPESESEPRFSATDKPRSTLTDFPREDILSRERFQTRLPDDFPQDDGEGGLAFSGQDSENGAGSPVVDPPELTVVNPTEAPDPETDPPEDPGPGTNLGDGPIDVSSDVAASLGLDEGEASLSLSVGPSTEEGAPLTVENDLEVKVDVAAAETEVVAPAAQPAPAQESAVVRIPSEDGRVRIGQNSLYSNALGGSVSGLIGGLEAPNASGRVAFRATDGRVSIQQSGTAVGVTVPNAVTSPVPFPSTAISVNGANTVQIPASLTTSVVPASASGGGSVTLPSSVPSGGSGPVSVPSGIPASGGANVNLRTNIVPSTGVRVNAAGVNIKVGL